MGAEQPSEGGLNPCFKCVSQAAATRLQSDSIPVDQLFSSAAVLGLKHEVKVPAARLRVGRVSTGSEGIRGLQCTRPLLIETCGLARADQLRWSGALDFYDEQHVVGWRAGPALSSRVSRG